MQNAVINIMMYEHFLYPLRVIKVLGKGRYKETMQTSCNLVDWYSQWCNRDDLAIRDINRRGGEHLDDKEKKKKEEKEEKNQKVCRSKNTSAGK